jgi:hypothetical protein
VHRESEQTKGKEVPVEDGAGISESGKPVEQTEGVTVLTMDEGEVVLAVGSGRYEFAGKVAR